MSNFFFNEMLCVEYKHYKLVEPSFSNISCNFMTIHTLVVSPNSLMPYGQNA